MSIALDDFGCGYANLQQLYRFRPEQIKIDRSFISKIGLDPHSEVIVAALLSLSQNFGVGVVAEGVETLEQANWLWRHGCDVLQGFCSADHCRRQKWRRICAICRNRAPCARLANARRCDRRQHQTGTGAAGARARLQWANAQLHSSSKPWQSAGGAWLSRVSARRSSSAA